MNDSSRLTQLFRKLSDLQHLGVLAALVLVVAVTTALEPAFLGSDNINNVTTNAAILAIVAFGMAYVIGMAGLDLSVGAVQALSAVLAAEAARDLGMAQAILVGLGVGLLVGCLNGAIIARLAVPAFIATLGMASVVRGGALLHTNGESVIINNPGFGELGSGRVLGVPVPVLIGLGMFLVLWGVLQHTRFGRHAIAVGGNPSAAVASGIRVAPLTVAVYGLAGMCAGAAGILTAAQLGNVDATIGQGFELEVILVAVLGGASLYGGRANLPGTVLAALLVAAISASLNVLNVQSYYQYLAIGLLLILALSIDTVRHWLTGSKREAVA